MNTWKLYFVENHAKKILDSVIYSTIFIIELYKFNKQKYLHWKTESRHLLACFWYLKKLNHKSSIKTDYIMNMRHRFFFKFWNFCEVFFSIMYKNRMKMSYKHIFKEQKKLNYTWLIRMTYKHFLEINKLEHKPGMYILLYTLI